MNTVAHLLTVLSCLRTRLARRIGEDAGYTTEAVLVTALLVALAITVIAIIVAKVTAEANSIDLG